MKYEDYIFHLDHYDSWTYTIFGTLSFFSALLFIILNIKFKESRRFPGNLLIIISLSEMILSLHWALSGFYTIYVSGRQFDGDSTFCIVNSHFAFLAGTVELSFQIAFLFSIIIQFRDTMRQIKYKSPYLIMPTAFSLLAWGYAWYKKGLGLNIFGTCSVNQMDKSEVTYALFTSFYMLMVLYTIYTLRKYKKLSENQITIRDDFYKFYIQYAIMTFFMYISSGASYLIDKHIYDGLKNSKDDESQIMYLKWFYISRLTNNVKIFIPIFTFLIRINDPFIKKLIQRFYLRKKMNETMSL